MQRLHTPREYFLLPFVMLQLLYFNSIVLTITEILLGLSTMSYRRQHSCVNCGINEIVTTATNATAVSLTVIHPRGVLLKGTVVAGV